MSWPPELLQDLDPGRVGDEIYAFAERAFPLCRSITGNGVRQTLELLREIVPELEIHEVATGTPVLDWSVPNEWNVREAWIKRSDGTKVVDFADHNLHLLGYSEPVHAHLDLADLQEHLYSLPEQPEVIPYRTSYWRRHWGFCLSHTTRQALEAGTYEVFIDSSLEPGRLTYGELALDATAGGDTGEEPPLVLVSAHICHPSLANDNLSGLGVCVQLAKQMAAQRQRRFGYRFIFVPGTIGAITWLARNRQLTDRIAHGMVLANLGDSGDLHWKRSRRGETPVDRAVEQVLADTGLPHQVLDFEPFGYDERQYCSPGFDLPVGLLSRTPWGQFPEYHTSGDNLDLIQPQALGDSYRRALEVLFILEGDRRFENLSPHGEPQLGRRGLYHHIGGGEEGRRRQLALLWVLNLSDGEHSLLDIAGRSSLPFAEIVDAANALLAAELLAAIH